MASRQIMTSVDKYKLYYFNFRGRAEVIRLVLVQAGQQFEDKRFWNEEWAEFDANPEACRQLESWNDEEKAKMPLRQLPVLGV